LGTNLRINADRLWDSLMDMAKIGATEKGGVCRLALTDLDKQARDLFCAWAKEAGCTSYRAKANTPSFTPSSKAAPGMRSTKNPMTMVTTAGNNNQLNTSTAATPSRSASQSSGRHAKNVVWPMISATPIHSAAKQAIAMMRPSATTRRSAGADRSATARVKAEIMAAGFYAKREAGPTAAVHRRCEPNRPTAQPEGNFQVWRRGLPGGRMPLYSAAFQQSDRISA